MLRRGEYQQVLQSLSAQDEPWKRALSAIALAGRGQLRSGIERARAALAEQLRPLTRAEVLATMGIVLLRRGHPELARPWLEQAAALDPENASVSSAIERCRSPDYLPAEAADPVQGQTLRRYAPREKRP